MRHAVKKRIVPERKLILLPAFTAVSSLLLTMSTVRADQDFTSVFNDAKTWGATTTQGTGAQINPSTSSGSIPNYAPSSSQSGFFAGGQGMTLQPGLDKADACAISPATGTPYNQQECVAINFMRNSPSVRPQYTVTRNDPLLQAGAAVTANPYAVLGPNTVSGNYSACTTTQQTTSPQYETEVCHEFSSLVNNSCSVGLAITVDAQHLYQCAEQLQNLTTPTCNIPRRVDVEATYHYQCAQSPKQLTNQTCNKNVIVTVDRSNSCEPGSSTGEFWVNTWGNDEVGVRYAGISITARCDIASNIHMDFHAICTEQPCSGSASVDVDPATGASSPQTFSNFTGRSWYESDAFNQVKYLGGNCNGTSCSFGFCTSEVNAPRGTTNGIRACGTFNFDQPRLIYTQTDSINDQCVGLEQRAQ